MHRSGIVLLATLLAACGGQPAAPTTPSPAGSGTPAPTASEPGAPVVFAWPEGAEPAVTRELAGSTHSFINPGAVIEHDGTLHMFANLFTEWPGPVVVQHLTSDDGVAWALVDEEPALTSADVPFADPGADVSTGFVADDGTWVLVFQSVNRSAPWEIGLATADGPDGPWTVAPDPVLPVGEEGEWDAGGHAWPSVVRSADGYLMLFSAHDGSGTARVIGAATSADGLTWTKEAEPVLTPEASWEFGSLDRPRAVATDEGFLMLYAGGRLTDRGLARSADGLAWERVGERPVITQDDFPVDGGAWDAALLLRDEQLHYYLEIGGGTPTTGTQVYRAVADVP